MQGLVEASSTFEALTTTPPREQDLKHSQVHGVGVEGVVFPPKFSYTDYKPVVEKGGLSAALRRALKTSDRGTSIV